MNLVREPDAGNPPVRFDEREVETEHGMRLLRHRRGNPDTEYVEAYPTAPPLDSTLLSPFCPRSSFGRFLDNYRLSSIIDDITTGFTVDNYGLTRIMQGNKGGKTMSRPKHEHPTPAELEVLKLLWERGPSTVRKR